MSLAVQTDGVDEDAIRGKLRRQRARQRVECRLADLIARNPLSGVRVVWFVEPKRRRWGLHASWT